MHVTMMHMLGGKRNVFSLDLNVSNDKLFLMSIGIVFHSFGAATEKGGVAGTVRVWGAARNVCR